VKIVEDHFRDRFCAGDRARNLDATGEDETQHEGVDLPVTLQLTALRMEREWESRTRMNIGPSRFPPALDHVGYSIT
jgi:hypothetical protein